MPVPVLSGPPGSESLDARAATWTAAARCRFDVSSLLLTFDGGTWKRSPQQAVEPKAAAGLQQSRKDSKGVDCISDRELEAKLTDNGRERLSLVLEPASVACLAHLERRLASKRTESGDVTISVSRAIPDLYLVVFLDNDTGKPSDARKVTLTDNQAMINATKLFGRQGSLIVKRISETRFVDQLRIEP